MRGMGGVAVVVVMMPLLGMIWITVARAATASFLPRSDVPLGPPSCEVCPGAPFGIAAGDLDGDGAVDVATANNSSADVSVLLGDRSGGFVFGTSIAVGDQPAAIAAGLVDGDGRLDLVVANEAANTLSIARGRDGGFDAASSIDIASAPGGGDNAPSDAVLAELNGDRTLDVVAVSLCADKLTVVLGNGDGTFREPVVTDLSGGPIQLAAGDLDGDRDVDLAVALNNDAAVAVLLGDARGSFAPSASLTVEDRPSGIVIADLDRDRIADIAVTNEFSDTVSVLRGKGEAAFAAAENYDVGAAPVALAAADFDGDGRLDLVSADNLGTQELDSSVSVLTGRGDGTFSPALVFATGAGAFDVVAADVNGDRRPDVLTVNMEGNDVSVLLNASDGPAFGCIGDCDLDGAVEIDELVLGVGLSIDPAALDACPSIDANGDQRIGVDEVLRAVRGALSGCESDGTVREP
jgi:hypothetical protein